MRFSDDRPQPINLMQFPTHEEISHRALQLWQDSGCASSADVNWFEAERQLSEGTTPYSDYSEPVSSVHHTLNESSSSRAVEQRAAEQKRDARAPQMATHTAPKPVPAATGKPLWSRPHSS